MSKPPLLAVLPALLLSLAAPSAAMAVDDARKLAVLEFDSQLTPEDHVDRTYFSDKVREVMRRQLPPDKFTLMTRENTEELLSASGKTLSDCAGNCEVETGKLLQADLVVSGRLTGVGSRFKLSMRLHQTKDAALLSSSTASGPTVEALDDAAQSAIEDLISPLVTRGASSPATRTVLVVTSEPPGVTCISSLEPGGARKATWISVCPASLSGN